MDRKIIVREQVNNWYHLRNYYFAKTTADLPFQTVFTIIFCTLYYWMSSQPYESFRYLYFIAISVLASITSMSYGIMFGAGTSIEAAVCLSVVFAIPVAGFSGLFIRFTAMPRFLRWISSVSYLAYAFEGIIVTIYGYNRTELECRDDDLCLFSKPTLILDELGINNEAIYIDFIGILISFFFFRILTYVILYWKFKTE